MDTILSGWRLIVFGDPPDYLLRPQDSLSNVAARERVTPRFPDSTASLAEYPRYATNRRRVPLTSLRGWWLLLQSLYLRCHVQRPCSLRKLFLAVLALLCPFAGSFFYFSRINVLAVIFRSSAALENPSPMATTQRPRVLRGTDHGALYLAGKCCQ